MANETLETDIHYKGEFSTIYDVLKKYPVGGVTGDYVVIAGWKHYWTPSRGTWCVNERRDEYWDEQLTAISNSNREVLEKLDGKVNQSDVDALVKELDKKNEEQDEAIQRNISKSSIGQELSDSEEEVPSQKLLKTKVEEVGQSIGSVSKRVNSLEDSMSEVSKSAKDAQDLADENKKNIGKANLALADLNKKVDGLVIPKVVYLTQDAYDALKEKDPDTTYLCTEE